MTPDDFQPAAWLELASKLWPERPALIAGSKTWSFSELYQRLGVLADLSGEWGLGDQGTPFAVLTGSRLAAAWAVYLALYSAVPLALLDHQRSGIARLLRLAGARLVVVDPELEALLPANVRTVSALWFGEASGRRRKPRSPAPAQNVQLLVPTSGSTGSPKLVMLSSRNLAAAAEGANERLALRAGDVWLVCLPLVHIGGLSVLLRCARAGATAVLMEKFDPDAFWNSLVANRATHVSLVPPMLERLLDRRPQSPPPTLRVALVGGGRLVPALAQRALQHGWPLCLTYGMTETASQVATLCGSEVGSGHGCGMPLRNIGVEITDDRGFPCDGPGRVRISGPAVMLGYANPSGTPGLGLVDGKFTSADRGFVDVEGALHILGRVDEVLVSGGRNIHPAEVESVLAGCPGVRDVAVTAADDPVWGHRLVALLVGDVSLDLVEGWSRQHLPSSLRPRRYLIVPELPRNDLGKLRRAALPALVAGDER